MCSAATAGRPVAAWQAAACSGVDTVARTASGLRGGRLRGTCMYAERGRHAASIYQQMGVSDFVAANQSDYVSIAVRLGTDDEYHEAAVARIRASYLDAHRAGAVAGEWAGAFLRMARGAI